MLDGSQSSDPDGHLPLSYQWTQIAGPRVELSDPYIQQPSFTAPLSDGVMVFELRVSDRLGMLSDVARVQITISNTAPIARAGDDQTVLVGSVVTLDGSGSFDPDEHAPLSYRWRQIAGASVELRDPSSARTSFRAPESPGVVIFELIVTDRLGAVGVVGRVSITVQAAQASQYTIYLPVARN